MPGMPGSTQGPVPIVRMFGVTMEGNSVLAHIHGFTPYFFVPAQAGFKSTHCALFKVRGSTENRWKISARLLNHPHCGSIIIDYYQC